MKPQDFRSLVKECMQEVVLEKKQEQQQKNIKLSQLKESLRGVVREVLSEIASGNTKGKAEKPSKEEKEKVDKGYSKNGNERLDKDVQKQLSEMEAIVKGLNSNWTVCWDDRGDMVINAKNLLSVRITPKFENNFDIEAMVKMADRIKVVSVDWEQVKNFVKTNFGTLPKDTNAGSSVKKSAKLSAGKGESGKSAGPNNDLLKQKKVGDSKRDDKDYNEKQVSKDEDLPDAPMKDVGELKNLNKNIKKTTQVKPPKVKKVDGDEKLKTDLPGTKTFREKNK